MMHSTGYRELTQKLVQTADSVCGGRLLMCHEGGYNAPTVPYFGLAVLEQLSGIKTPIDDPFAQILQGLGGQNLQPHQDAVIQQAETLLDTFNP
jgi:acetoin utilization deacetylase AcuC-like enzyme